MNPSKGLKIPFIQSVSDLMKMVNGHQPAPAPAPAPVSTPATTPSPSFDARSADVMKDSLSDPHVKVVQPVEVAVQVQDPGLSVLVPEPPSPAVEVAVQVQDPGLSVLVPEPPSPVLSEPVASSEPAPNSKKRRKK